MLQPRILVDSHRVQNKQQTNFKLNSPSADRQNNRNSIIMWSSKRCQKSTSSTFPATSTCINSCTNKRRHYSVGRFATPSIHNLATFLILAVTVYSSTLCMAQLSGKSTKKKIPFLFHFSCSVYFFPVFHFDPTSVTLGWIFS